MKAYRQRKRAAGVREIRLRLRDTRTPEFIAEALRQSALIATSEGEREVMGWLDAVQSDLVWPPFDS
jgi:hypothetical protein